LGTGYVLAMEAVACADASTLAREQVKAVNKEALLPAIDEAAAKMRRKLGESLKSIQQFDVPIQDATTQSLEAMKAYSLGNEQRSRGAEKDSLPFFDHAIELDPNFAMAYATRGAALNNLGESERAAGEFRKAYELRVNLSEREKLYLTVRYMDTVTGDTLKAIETFELWHQLYPRDLPPLNGLSARYQIVGEYEKAVAASREALGLRPDYYVGYANLASSFEALNRFDEAKKICAAAAVSKHDSLYTHQTAFEIASLEHDQAALQREIAVTKGTPSEDTIITLQALAAASSGKLRLARQLFEGSVARRKRDGLNDHAAYTIATEAQIEADLGNTERAMKLVREALKLGRGIDAEETAAEALSLLGKEKEASSLAEDLRKRFPAHVPLNPASLPCIYGEIQIHKGNPAKAVQILQQAIPYELSEFANLSPAYIRGQAFLRMGYGKEASSEFQKYREHSGVNALFPRHTLALVGLARAYVLMGDTAKAHKAYEDFFVLWSEADPDIPFLLQARSEYQKLH
jgi:tetratricopeptide (TPR) repeat protein